MTECLLKRGARLGKLQKHMFFHNQSKAKLDVSDM